MKKTTRVLLGQAISILLVAAAALMAHSQAGRAQINPPPVNSGDL